MVELNAGDDFQDWNFKSLDRCDSAESENGPIVVEAVLDGNGPPIEKILPTSSLEKP